MNILAPPHSMFVQLVTVLSKTISRYKVINGNLHFFFVSSTLVPSVKCDVSLLGIAAA